MEERIHKLYRPLTTKQEYKLLSKEEKKIVAEFVVVLRKYKRNIGSLRMVECLKKALDTSLI